MKVRLENLFTFREQNSQHLIFPLQVFFFCLSVLFSVTRSYVYAPESGKAGCTLPFTSTLLSLNIFVMKAFSVSTCVYCLGRL